jgi:hypothetical protein
MTTSAPDIRNVHVTRYVTPLREGGSLPAIAEADDGFLYVLKFRGAGQGIKALIAELIGGELARAAGFRIPELVFAHLDEAFGRTEPDEEIQDLLKHSIGLNLALHYLQGSITYDPAAHHVDPLLASKIVWFDGLITNVDRSYRNTNMLIWHDDLWLIDHGAALYFHHSWEGWQQHASTPFSMVKDHVLLRQASELEQAEKLMKELITPDIIRAVTSAIPNDWLESAFEQPAAEVKDVYASYLITRLSSSSLFLNEAIHARTQLI